MSTVTVALRPAVEADREPMFRLESDRAGADLIAFLPREPGDREAFDRSWARLTGEDGLLLRTIEVDGGYGGYVVSFVADGEREVGYWVDRALWGRGVASEALRQLLALLPERPLFARASTANVASRRVLEKAGFVVIGEEHTFAPRFGRNLPNWVLRLDAAAGDAAGGAAGDTAGHAAAQTG